MSISALNWAFRAQAGSSSRKLVLIALANWCGANNETYPSVEAICGVTELNRKTVLDTLHGLADAGLILDTGRRTGRSNGVRVWRLAVPETGTDFGHEAVPISDSRRYQKRDTDTFMDTFMDTGIRAPVPKTVPVRGLTARPRVRSLDADIDRPLSAQERRALDARRLDEGYFGQGDEQDRQRIAAARRREIGGNE